MITKEKLKEINTLEECQNYLRSELVKYKTLFNKVYSDYEGKNYTEQIKAYENGNNYVIVYNVLEGTKTKNMSVYVTKTKPSKPHPLFPVPRGFIQDAKEFEYGEKNFSEEEINVDDYLEEIKQKQKAL